RHAFIGLEKERLDPCRRSARLVSVVLPLLYGPPPARRGPSADRPVESLQTPCGADQASLRQRRYFLPPASAPGLAAMGLRQTQNLTPHTTCARAAPDRSHILIHPDGPWNPPASSTPAPFFVSWSRCSPGHRPMPPSPMRSPLSPPVKSPWRASPWRWSV